MQRYVIFANGRFDPKAAEWLEPNDFIICADGGTLHAQKLDIVPDVIIGDMDSIPEPVLEEMKNQGVAIIRHPVNKDKTDLELALDYATEQHATEILILTALGGRLDQSFANILLLTRENQPKTQIQIRNENVLIQVMTEHQSLTLNPPLNSQLSLLPISENVHIKTLSGVKWLLKDETLERGQTRGISNSTTNETIDLQIGQGICMLVIEFA